MRSIESGVQKEGTRASGRHCSLFTAHCSLFIVVFFTTMIPACGYHNPYVNRQGETVPPRKVYVDVWPNRTNELGLEAQLYRTLISWLKKSKHIQATGDRDSADYLLDGEISAINIPGLSYGLHEQAVEVSVYLTLRYSLREKQTGRILWGKNGVVFEEPVSIETDPVTTRDNKKKALVRICEDLADSIYIRLLNTLP